MRGCDIAKSQRPPSLCPLCHRPSTHHIGSSQHADERTDREQRHAVVLFPIPILQPPRLENLERLEKPSDLLLDALSRALSFASLLLVVLLLLAILLKCVALGVLWRDVGEDEVCLHGEQEQQGEGDKERGRRVNIVIEHPTDRKGERGPGHGDTLQLTGNEIDQRVRSEPALCGSVQGIRDNSPKAPRPRMRFDHGSNIIVGTEQVPRSSSKDGKHLRDLKY